MMLDWDLNSPGFFALAAPADELGYHFEKFGPHISYSSDAFAALFQELHGGDLFSSNPLILVTGCEAFSDKELEQLTATLKSPSNTVRAVFGFTSLEKAKVRAFFSATPRSHSYLGEKPWERSGRLCNALLHDLQSRKKKMSKEALERFEELNGKGPLIRLRELEKLIAFIGGRDEITLADVEAVCLSHAEVSAFKALDYILEGRADLLAKLIAGAALDLSSLLGFIFPLRHQLAMGAAVLEGRSSYLKKKYPYLQGSRLSKQQEKLRGATAHHLEALYGRLIDFEVFAKGSQHEVSTLRSLLLILLQGGAWAS